MTKKKWTIKQLCLLIATLLLATMTAGGSLAYIFTSTQGVTNTFQPSEVTCKVIEDDWTDNVNTTKNNVKVMNTGDTAAYIRAAVVITWQSEDERNEVVLAEQPQVNDDYTISINESAWDLGDDGYYYHKTPVAVGGNTAVLINSCTVVSAQPGYTLHVEIIADAVQAEPTDAVEEAWGVTVNRTTISK